MLTLLDRYIFKRLADSLLLGLVVFTLLLFFSDALLDFMKDIQHYGVSWDIAITLIGLQIPRILVLVIPMSALLATMMVYRQMNSQFELITMRSAGISLMRLARPALLLGLLAAGMTYVLQDFVVPTSIKYARGLKTYALHQQNLPAIRENFTYKQFDKNQQLKRLLYISEFKKDRFGYTTLIDLTNPKTLQITQARAGEWGQQSLELQDANVYTISSLGKLTNTTSASHLELQHFMQPQESIEQHKTREMSLFSLVRWIGEQKRLGKTVPPKVFVTLWEKLTIPLSSLPLVMIAVPLAMTSPRKLGNMGFLVAIVIYFLYYLMRHISVHFGETGAIPPVLAAALPLLVVLATAGLLFQRKNRVL